MTHRILLIVVLLSAVVQAQVSYDRLLRAGAEPHNWLTYSGTYSGHRYSTLNQITPQNVRDLELKWVFQARSLEKFEATPLVVDGVMYTVQPPNDIVAIDAGTGFTIEPLSEIPVLDAGPETEIVGLAQELSGRTELGKVSFGTEGSQFQRAGIPTVVCGPGSIEQAHKPNEFIALEQIRQCEAFVGRLIERAAAA